MLWKYWLAKTWNHTDQYGFHLCVETNPQFEYNYSIETD